MKRWLWMESKIGPWPVKTSPVPRGKEDVGDRGASSLCATLSIVLQPQALLCCCEKRVRSGVGGPLSTFLWGPWLHSPRRVRFG